MTNTIAIGITLSLSLAGACVMEVEPGAEDADLINLEASGGDLPPDWQVCTWEHASYEGARTCWSGLPAGEYWLPILVGYAVGNDMMSSVALSRGVSVILFEHINYEGAHITMWNSSQVPMGSPDVSGYPVGNDAASSIVLKIP